MAFRTEGRITIATGVHEVWAYVCDVERWPEWAPGVLGCWVGEGAALAPGSLVEQRARKPLGFTTHRAQSVTVVEPPHRVAFAGPMGSSAARWGMQLEALDERRTEAMMWIEVDLGGYMRVIPERVLEARIRRVSDRELAAMKAVLENTP